MKVSMLLSFSSVPGKEQFHPLWTLLDQVLLIYIYIKYNFCIFDSQEDSFFNIFSFKSLGYTVTIQLNSNYILANLTYQTNTTENIAEIPIIADPQSHSWNSCFLLIRIVPTKMMWWFTYFQIILKQYQHHNESHII